MSQLGPGSDGMDPTGTREPIAEWSPGQGPRTTAEQISDLMIRVQVLQLVHARTVPVPTGDGLTGGGGHMTIYDADPVRLEPNQIRIGRYLFTLPKPVQHVEINLPSVRFLYADGTEETCEMRES